MVGRRGGYARKKVVAGDLVVPKQGKSTWERNLMRVLKYQKRMGIVTHWEYETRKLLFPGKSEDGKGNMKVHIDFPVVAWIGDLGLPGLETPYHDPKWDYHPSGRIEVKGRLDFGGRIDKIDLVALDAHGDSDSRIKGQRTLRHYKEEAPYTWYIGAREYRLIRAKFRPLIPDWED